MAIPVQNIYYLLSYAWDQFAPQQIENVASEPFPDALHLFTSMLDYGVRALHQRGFETGYITIDDITSSPRGRILISPTVRLKATQPARVQCAYDELSEDVLTNQILKATLSRILGTDEVDRDLRGRIHRTYRLLARVSSVDLDPRIFHQVHLHQNNRLYAFLMNLCRFLYDSLLPTEATGAYRFFPARDFDGQLAGNI